MSEKAIVIGLDGADWKLINHLLETGEFPTFKKLKEKGSSGKLRSVIPTSSAPAWTSFLTGKDPGKHGIYDFLKLTENKTKRPVTSKDRKAPCMWDFLSDEKKVISLNVPLTYPPEELNGIMISGLPAPEESANYCYPKEVYGELEENFHSFKIQPEFYYSENNESEFLRDQFRCWNNTEKVFRYLKDRKDWNLFICVFHVLDEVSHELWRFIDEDHPRHEDRRIGKYIFKFYKKADEFLSKVVEDLDENSNLIVISDHGFGPVYKTIYINNWLIERGWLQLKTNFFSKLKKLLHDSGLTRYNLLHFLRRTGLNPLNLSYKETFTSESSFLKLLSKKLFLSEEDIDWEKSKIFSLGEFGQLYFKEDNVENYERFLGRVKEELEKLKNPRTGDILFDEVLTKEELYGEEASEEAPDIVFFDRGLNFLPVKMFEFGSEKLLTPQAVGRSGGHKLNGIFLAYGKDIENTSNLSLKITDIAPTLLYLFGEKVPRSMDGNVKEEVFEESFLEEHKVEFCEPDVMEHRENRELDKEKIKDRLRGLGYF